MTAIVTSSVGLVTGPDGEQHVVLANAIDPADNVSRLESAMSTQHSAKADYHKEHEEHQGGRIFKFRSPS